jgi:hypothetical protein
VTFVAKRGRGLKVPARVLVGAALASLAVASPARAVVHSDSVVDGPSNEILEVDGAAMAPDGTGGIVYRKAGAGGIPHVYVARFINGQWVPPVQVDTSDPFGASMPAIAAGEGGRLLVVWVQARNVNTNGTTLYSLMSASVQPGSSSFGPAVTVDPNVGEPYNGDITAVDPSLAMDPASGQAYVAYRVIANDCEPSLGLDPPSSLCDTGGKLVEVRVARYEYLRWSLLGAVNRAPQIAMRDPTSSNAPSIGIDLDGNGLIAWQEPESPEGAARIWVRRLFGVVQGNVLQASPEAIDGRPVTSDAEAPYVAMSPYGEARIVFRVHGAPGSAVPTTQLYMNSISSEVDLNAARLTGPVRIGGVSEAALGVPSGAVERKGYFRLTWTEGQAVRELGGGLDTSGQPVSIGSTAGQLAPSTINPAGGGTVAWLASVGGLPAVDVREDFAQGAFQLDQFGGPIPGPISGLSLGGSGQGDALLAWMVGSPGRAEVVGDFVQAPPQPFNVFVPKGWVHEQDATISWEPATDAVAGTTYTVYVDGKPRIGGLTGLSAGLGQLNLGNGVHPVQVLAVDASGQETMSDETDVDVDSYPPTVTLKLIDRRHGVRVMVVDHASGVDTSATQISFGDGAHATGTSSASHVYEHAGTYTITALVRDKVGIQATDRLRVRVL